MDGNARWVVSFIIVIALAGAVLVASAGSACAATISGTVTDGSKTYVPGATVTLYQGGVEYVAAGNPTTTSINGYYAFSGLSAGDYSVSVEKVTDRIYSTSATARIETGDVTLDLQILGYTYKPGTATLPPGAITAAPTKLPTATPTAIPKPAAKVSNTPVPLPPPPPDPGFEMPLAVVSLGLLALLASVRRRQA